MTDPGTDLRHAPTLPTPFYEEDGIVLYNADCREILPLLGPVDLVITSPPYNINKTTAGDFPHRHRNRFTQGAKWTGGVLATGYDTVSDDLSFPEYEAWQRHILTLCWQTLSEEGAIFYNHKPRPQANGLWVPLIVNPGLPLRQIITWARAGGINCTTTHYMPTYEWILVFAKHTFRLRDQAASGVGDLWYIPQESNTPHPAPFPLKLPLKIIGTTRAETILDPFCGSGTTAVACLQLGRKFIGIEISEAYCQIIVERLRQAVLPFPVKHPVTPAQAGLFGDE